MIAKYTPNTFIPCPEYTGVARIVDVTDMKPHTSQYGTKDQFRYILEVDVIKNKEAGSRFTVATAPMSLSLHEKAALRKFVQKVLGRELTEKELAEGVDTETLVGKSVNVVVEHVKSADGTKTYSNLAFVQVAKTEAKWESEYVRFKDREDYEKDAAGEEAEESVAKGK
jgi:hypothetical protein